MTRSFTGRPADWQSATRQVGNLRYRFIRPRRVGLLALPGPPPSDAIVLHPPLTAPLQSQDNPTRPAFGPKDRPGRLGISVRDFARFGLLFLHESNWRGQQRIKPEGTASFTAASCGWRRDAVDRHCRRHQPEKLPQGAMNVLSPGEADRREPAPLQDIQHGWPGPRESCKPISMGTNG